MILATWEAIGRRITVKASPKQNQETLPKTWLKQKGAGGMAEVGEHRPSKHEGLTFKSI
jgi:hypothetical protein